MESNADDLVAFRDFVVQQVGVGPCAGTPEELVRQWRREVERASLAEDLRVGLEDYAAGKGRPAKEVLDEIRNELGLGK